MTTPVPLPAGWSPSTALLGDSWAVLAPEVRDAALRWAVQVLWKLSGRQFGIWEVTLAPYLTPPSRGWYDHPTHRTGGGGGWLSTTGGGVRLGGYGTGGASGVGVAGCHPFRVLRLPGPVAGVSQVVVDGAVLDALAWTCDPDGALVRTDGQAWPVGQDVYVPRWLVRYTRGLPAPEDANAAAGRYALELARAAVADPKCKLPARTRDVTRQGISVSLSAPEDLAVAGMTGVPQVDAWLRAVNPDSLSRAATIWTPAVTRHRVLSVTTPGT